MKTFHINGRKTYYVCTSIEAEDEFEAEVEFHKMDLSDFHEVVDEQSNIEEIWSEEEKADTDE